MSWSNDDYQAAWGDGASGRYSETNDYLATNNYSKESDYSKEGDYSEESESPEEWDEDDWDGDDQEASLGALQAKEPSAWYLALADARQAYRFPAVILPILLLALAAWGASDGINDTHGDRGYGALPMIAPAVLAVWWSVRGAFMRDLTVMKLAVRMISASLYAPVPLIAGILLSMVGLWLVPANRAILDGAASHHWWQKIMGSAIIKTGTASLGEQLLITGLMGLLIASFAGLMASILFLLPMVSLRRSRSIFGFTIPGQGNTAGFVFGGFAVMTTGLALLVALGEDMGFWQLHEWIELQSRDGWNVAEFGTADWQTAGWGCGVLLVTLGTVLIAGGIVAALSAWGAWKSTAFQSSAPFDGRGHGSGQWG